jgi:hypothetical protein
MSVTPSPIGGFAAQFFDNNGVILSGGKIYTYAAGTTIPQATYTNASGAPPHTNPIVLESAGRVPGGEIWLTDGLVYKFVIETSTGGLLGTYDNITGVNSNFVNYTVQEEVITATAGQTVFNLSTINYTPGTNSLSVYIDGVNQYVGDSYLETDSNTVTFTAGVHVGGEVKFTTAIQTTTGAVDASIVSYDPPFTGSVATNVEAKLAQYVSVKDFGAVGDGVTDDTATIADALATGASVYFPEGTYKTDLQTITTAGQTLFGAGEKSIILAKTAGANLFVVEADYVSFRNLRMNGAETGSSNNDFAIFTATATPAQFLAVENVLFSGASAASGFNNAVKFDSGCNYGSVIGCVIERLWGNLSGNGYGILNGANNATFRDNTLLASSGRGRHGIYISSGASDNEISGNFLSSFDLEGITQYSTGVQPACSRNKYIGNSLIACAASNNPTSGSIGIYGHSSGAVISANTITSSGQIGIAVDGTGVTDCANTIISDNFVAFSATTGINLISPIACSVTGNIVYESSTASVGTSANIQIKSDGTTAPSDILIEGNHAWGPVYSRSAVRIDPTTPTPVKTKLQFNAFSAGASGTIETNSVSGIQIDGRLQFTFLGVSYGPIANGAAFAGGLSLPGADQGDICTVSHTSNTDGCLFTVQATSTNNGTLNIGNLSGGSKTIASGTLRVDVWKRYS